MSDWQYDSIQGHAKYASRNGKVLRGVLPPCPVRNHALESWFKLLQERRAPLRLNNADLDGTTGPRQHTRKYPSLNLAYSILFPIGGGFRSVWCIWGTWFCYKEGCVSYVSLWGRIGSVDPTGTHILLYVIHTHPVTRYPANN